jgi:two-component system chemotaxis response regulator CheY
MSKTILLVDDSRTVRMLVARTLVGAGYAVIEAGDGLEALGKLAGETAVSLVVCDVNMPTMGGLELLDAARAAGRPEAFVMLTTEGDAKLIDRARSLGASAWLVKPFKPELLLTAVTRALSAGGQSSSSPM